MNKLPTDAKLYALQGANGAVYYAILFEPTPGVRIVYTVADPSVWDTAGKPWQPIAESQFNATPYVAAGEDGEISQYVTGDGNETYGQFWNKLVDNIFGPYDPARNDPGVLGVLAEWAGRPDMSETELLTMLERTPYWQNLTEQRQRWHTLPGGEQQYQIAEWRSRLADEYFRLTGIRTDPTDEGGWLNHWAYMVASGQMPPSAVTAKFREEAAKNPESPFSRETRAEQETQRQRWIDIDNATGKLEGLARRWGVQLSADTILDWATRIVGVESSEDDFVEYLKRQAAVLYQMKDPEMETWAYAEPWVQTYQRVMEQSADLLHPEIQRAIQQGLTPWQLEQELKRKDEWLNTRNGQQEMMDAVSSVAETFGFN